MSLLCFCGNSFGNVGFVGADIVQHVPSVSKDAQDLPINSTVREYDKKGSRFTKGLDIS